jgi:hypothetical protein
MIDMRENPLRDVWVFQDGKRGDKVRMADLEIGDIFALDEVPGYWRVTGNPYIRFDGGNAVWAIMCCCE